MEDRQFERFRRTGSGSDLGAVFDATAPELWRVAWYLSAGDRHRAEDALQATFLTAIENRDRWDADRKLRPWLLGILANHVRNDRRRSRQAMGSQDAVEGLVGVDQPLDQVETEEINDLVSAVMRELPQPYREVIILHLEHGLSAREISEATGRKAGTVRTQVVRGLELLRKSLPAGVTAGVALAMSTVAQAAAALGRVREGVLAHAGAAGVGVMAVTTWKLNLKKIAMIATILVAVTVTILAPWSVPEPEPSAEESVTTVPMERVESPSSVGSKRTEVSGTAASAGSAPQLVAQDSTLKVLVVGPDDKPVPHAPLMFHGGRNQRARFITTDSGGRFTFTNIPPDSHCRLDVVGRLSDSNLPVLRSPFDRAVTLKVKPGMHLDVKVVDRSGKPVAGAFVEGVLGAQWERMYNPLGRTDASGRLRLRNVSLRGQIVAYASGHQLAPHENVSGRVGETVPLTLTLGAPGIGVAGRVFLAGDNPADRKPCSGASLAIVQLGRRVSKQFFTSDGEGRFHADWLQPGRHLIVGEFFDGDVTRLGIVRFDHAGSGTAEVELVLRRGGTLGGIVRDGEGEPIPNASISAQYLPEAVYDLPFMSRRGQTDPSGQFRITTLLLGPNRCTVRHNGREVEATVEILEGAPTEWKPQFRKAMPMRLRIVDARGQGLSGWGVVMRNSSGFTSGSTYSTNSEGVIDHSWEVEFGAARSFQIHAPVPGGKGLRGDSRDYFPTLITPPLVAAPEPHTIRIPDGARADAKIEGRVLRVDGTVPERAQVQVRATNVPVGYDVDLFCDAATGEFSIGPLSRGRYKLTVSIPGARSFSRTVRVGAGQILDLGDLRSPREGALTIAPQHPDGSPVRRGDRVLVRVSNEHGASWWARTRDGAVYVARGVHQGDVTVTVWGRAHPPVQHRLSFTAPAARTVVKMQRPVKPTMVHVRLPVTQQRNQQGWSGTIVVRDGKTNALLIRRRVSHPFRGRFTRDLKFGLALAPGSYRFEVSAWDDLRGHSEAVVPGRRIEIALPAHR